MRNLAVVFEQVAQVSLGSSEEKLVAAAYDSQQGRFFFASDSCTVYCLPADSSCEAVWSVSLVGTQESCEVLDLQVGDRVIGLEYVVEEEALLVAIEAGDLLLLRLPAREVEVVGRVDGGLVSLAASPDGELLALATGLGRVLLMTQDWDVLYELSVDQASGDASRKVGGGTDGEWLSAGGIQMSWRGDGKYFTTLDLRGAGDVKIWERETGVLHACGEKSELPLTAIGWCPSGARICTSCTRTSTGRSPGVVFYEKNGLTKEGFDVAGPPEAWVDALGWNCDSSLLAVVLRCGDWDAVQVWNCRNYHWYLKQEWRFCGRYSVQILWDPEKPLRLTCWLCSGKVHTLDMCWKTAVLHGSLAFVIDGKDLLVTPLALAVIPPPMALFKLRFLAPIQTVCLNVQSSSKTSIAAYLSDGNLGVVSCPGVDEWVNLEDHVYSAHVVQHVPSFPPLGRLRHLVWLYDDALLGVQLCDTATVVGDGSIGEDHNRDVFVELKLSEAGSEDSRSTIDLGSWSLRAAKRVPADQKVVAMVVAKSYAIDKSGQEQASNTVFIQLVDGSVHCYLTNEQSLKASTVIKSIGRKFESPSLWMTAITLSGRPVVIGLSENGDLQVEDKIVSRGATSFALHYGAVASGKEAVVNLVYTTRADQLHVTNVHEVFAQDDSHAQSLVVSQVLPAPRKGSKNTFKSVPRGTMNVWERGAILVGVVSERDASVILQTVRGNLETLYPRKLVLGAIAAALVAEDFGVAMSLVRRHHINLNVIVDYKGWEAFVPLANAFVKQVNNLSHITDFVSSVSRDNVMCSLYQDLVPGVAGGKAGNEQAGSVNKIRGVLTAVRAALVKEVAPSPARELCILTTLACDDPPQLEDALQQVKNLREDEVKRRNMPASCNGGERPSAEPLSPSGSTLAAARAVKHLIWLTDADKVYNAALGLYDLHLAAMVASEAQRDPKEFLPVLEELEGMPEALMRHTIDLRLGKFDSALENLAAAGDDHFQDSLKLVQKNPQLFPLALQIFSGSDRRHEVMAAWGDHLMSEEKFVDAAAAFSASGQLDKVLLAYRAGGDWEGVLSVTGQLRMTQAQIKNLAYEVCDELQALGRPGDAAKVALEYLKDVDLSIKLMVDAQDWKEAARVASLHDRADLLAQVDNATLECANSHVKDFEEGLEKIGKYYTRYVAVRQRRLLLAAKLKEGQTEEEDLNDAASDTSSNVSGISGMSIYTRGTPSGPAGTSINPSTRASTRKQQKQARQKSRGKLRAGSPGEELALLEHLKDLALSTRTKEELGRLLQVLLFLAHEDVARKLQEVASRYECTQVEAVKLAEEKRAEEEPRNSQAIPDIIPSVSQVEEVRWKLEILSLPHRIQPASFLSVR